MDWKSNCVDLRMGANSCPPDRREKSCTTTNGSTSNKVLPEAKKLDRRIGGTIMANAGLFIKRRADVPSCHGRRMKAGLGHAQRLLSVHRDHPGEDLWQAYILDRWLGAVRILKTIWTRSGIRRGPCAGPSSTLLPDRVVEDPAQWPRLGGEPLPRRTRKSFDGRPATACHRRCGTDHRRPARTCPCPGSRKPRCSEDF